MPCPHTFIHSLILRLFLLSLSFFYFFTQIFPGSPDQENLSENVTKRKENFRESSVWNFSSSNLLTSSTCPGKHSLRKYPISQSRTGSAFLIITQLRSTQALYLHGQVQGQLFAQIFLFNPAKQFSTAMPRRDLHRNLRVMGSFTSKSILMQKKPEVHCWSSLEEFPLSVLIWSFF